MLLCCDFRNSAVRLGARPSLQIVAKRKWVKQECKPNSKPVLKSVHVNVGDTVQVREPAQPSRSWLTGVLQSCSSQTFPSASTWKLSAVN